MIEGVETKQLKPIPDERGWLMEILRCDDPVFKAFGQVYVTAAYPGVIKAWHLHEKQTDFFTVVQGMAKIVLYDDRSGSITKGEVNEFFIGEKNPMLLKIPSNIYHGFKGIGRKTAVILNLPDRPYNRERPDEHRLPYNTEKIPYDWSLKHG